MTFFLLDTLSFLVSLLGFRGIRILSYIIGTLWFDVLRIRRRIILSNLDIVYGKTISTSSKRHIGRKSIINFVSTALEFIAAEHILPKAKFYFKNKELVDFEIGKNAGLYTICMHFGNWEYLCYINAKQYSPVNVVVKDVLSGKPELWIKNLRHLLGYKLIDRHSQLSAAQQIFQAIDNNEIIGFIVDQKKPGGLVLPFFGKDTITNTGLSKLYFRKPAPIVGAIIYRLKPGHFCVEYFAFEYTRDINLSVSENIEKMSRKMNQMLEPIILQHPEEYYWLHNRWSLKK